MRVGGLRKMAPIFVKRAVCVMLVMKEKRIPRDVAFLIVCHLLELEEKTDVQNCILRENDVDFTRESIRKLR